MEEAVLTEEERKELAARGLRSPVEYARIFLPDWFPTKMPWVHRGVLALIRGRGNFLLDFGIERWRDEVAAWTPEDLDKILTNFVDERTGEPIFSLVETATGFDIKIKAKRSVVLMIPRGFSKTTLLNLNTLWETSYEETDFFLYLSEAAPHAQRQLETIKGELESNEQIRAVFGNIVPGRQESQKWSAEYIETLNGVQVGALGTGGKVRGYSKHAKRPKVLLFDDLQDEKSVESPTELANAKRWFLRAARPAKAKGGRDIMLGTLLHKESCINIAMEMKTFTAVRFGAIDRQNDMLWEFMMTREEFEEMKEEAASNGELAGFYMEYMSEFRDDDSAMFPESKMIYVHKGLSVMHAVGIALDPAISKSRKAAEAAMAVVGIESRGHKHVLDYYGQKGMDPYDMIDKYFDLHFRYMAHLDPSLQKHGIEAVQFQAALLPIMRTTMVEKSRKHGAKAYFEIQPIYHGKTQKEARIKGILKPLIWSGSLTFEQETRSGKLHNQFVEFGSTGTLVDGPDAVAMAVALLDPYVMLGLEESVEPQDLANDNQPSLESVFEGEWRMAP